MQKGDNWRRGVVLLSTLLVLAVTVSLHAQTPTLGEIARKEQERRKGVKAPGKVITNADLKNGGTAGSTASGGNDESARATPAETRGGAAGEQKTESEGKGEPRRSEAEWRTIMSQSRDELRRNELFLEALQSRINALTTDFAARDDPYQRAQIADERYKAISELERARANIQKSKQHVTDLEEEARKAGVPPGWLR
jgi:hypothetical protein